MLDRLDAFVIIPYRPVAIRSRPGASCAWQINLHKRPRTNERTRACVSITVTDLGLDLSGHGTDF